MFIAVFPKQQFLNSIFHKIVNLWYLYLLIFLLDVITVLS